ncbi:hypothetical protein UlMin_005194 [Ulmus minor]
MLGIISEYFQDIFLSSSPSSSDIASVLSCVDPKVMVDMINQLLRPFSSEEIKKALMDMNPTKAPGPDGLPALFFQNFWDIVGEDITKVIVSRNITNRFRLILDDVIGDPQSAFVPGRLITDNVILGFEAMDWIRQHTGGQIGYAALKLDMSKAYDMVEWSFLRGMMDKLGFAEQWTKLIMRCISSISYSFLINGEVKGVKKEIV